MFFRGSVKGLSAGAPVLLHGITIGKVLDVQLTFNADDFEFEVPVLLEIEPDRIGVTGDSSELNREGVLERLVEAGLRGQLKSGSLVTGQLYVDLDFHKTAPRASLSKYGDYRVVPTVAAPLDALSTKVNDILDKVGQITIERFGQDASEAVAGARELMGSAELKRMVTEAEDTLAQVRGLAEQLNVSIAPELSTTLKQTTSTLKSAESVIAENSPMYIELRRMFSELSSAARSVRVMAEYLERHPEALLKGKGNSR
jgi:paraquat-inducible protein B